MRVIYVDTQKNAHEDFLNKTKHNKEIASIDCFVSAEEALRFTKLNPVDCAFLDIDLGKDDCGLELAKNLKSLRPSIEIAFLTSVHEHAKTSYQLGGRAYLIKPCDTKELDDALDIIYRLVITRREEGSSIDAFKSPVQIQTFGNFDVMVNGCALAFKSSKAKEALAFLIHQRGGSVSGAQIFFALWETQEYTSATAIYVRRTIHSLKNELEKLGIADLLIHSRNCYSINVSRLNCDCYELLKGNKDAAHNFDGEYMRQYSWGESTIPLLERATQRVLDKK